MTYAVSASALTFTIMRLQQNLSISNCLNACSALSPFSINSKYGLYV